MWKEYNELTIGSRFFEDYLIWKHKNESVEILIGLSDESGIRIRCPSAREAERLADYFKKLADAIVLTIETLEEKGHEKDH